MNKDELKNIAESLIETFNYAGKESIRLYEKGLKIEIKEDNSPVSNGDLRVNELISSKISELTPNIPTEQSSGFLFAPIKIAFSLSNKFFIIL